MATTTQQIISGDNTTGHVISAASVGGALSGLITWGFELMHVVPPEDVTAGLGILCTVAASWLMQQISTPAPTPPTK